VALIASGKDVCELQQQLSRGAEIVVNWMAATGLELAIHKSEAMVITKTRTHNDLHIAIGGVPIKNVKEINYLGIIIDQRLNFTSHAAHVAAKAGKVARNLARILPNVSAATPKKRRLLAGVTHSILLYGSPIWSGKMSTCGLTELAECQRMMTLRVASAYCTVSTDAALVIAGIPPIDLLGSEHQTLARNPGARKADCRATLLSEWQSRWISSSKGRWTFNLIPDIRPWVLRSFGETNFHITQVLSGHGCFAQYLHRFGKLESSECWYCGAEVDDAQHTTFECDAWYVRRHQLCISLGIATICPRTMVALMLKSKDNWTAVSQFITEVLSKKEAEERRRQAINIED